MGELATSLRAAIMNNTDGYALFRWYERYGNRPKAVDAAFAELKRADPEVATLAAHYLGYEFSEA